MFFNSKKHILVVRLWVVKIRGRTACLGYGYYLVYCVLFTWVLIFCVFRTEWFSCTSAHFFRLLPEKICFQCRPLNFLCNKSCYCNHSMRLICECVDTHIDIYKISFDLWLFYFSSCIFPKKLIIHFFKILVLYYTG